MPETKTSSGNAPPTNPATTQDVEQTRLNDPKRVEPSFLLKYPLDIGKEQDGGEGYAIQISIYDIQGQTLEASKQRQPGGDPLSVISSAVGSAEQSVAAAAVSERFLSLSEAFATTNEGVPILDQFGKLAAGVTKSPVSVVSVLKNRRGTSESSKVGDIFLYIPTKVVDSYNFGWDTADLANLRVLSEIGDPTGAGFQQYLSREIALPFLQSSMLGSASFSPISSAAIGDIRTSVDSLTRSTRNPYLQFLFRSVSPRKFEFSFAFAPKSKEESAEVKRIIDRLRYYAHPSLSDRQKFYLNYPAEFHIRFLMLKGGVNNKTGNPYMPREARCACTGISVDYTGHGEGFSGHSDGSPAQINMSIAFDELKLLSREDLEDAR